MSGHSHEQHVPVPALVGAGLLILVTLGVAAHAHSDRVAHPPAVEPAIESTMVRFEDRADGSLAVLDDATGREDTVVPPRTNNFIRGVLRGMFRTRKLEAVGHEAPFRLAREANGRLTIDDPATGRRVDLDSFGPTNSAAFDSLLVAARTTR